MPHADILIVGAGQAGLALSRHLTAAGQDHVLLERGDVGERWRSERWDSLTLLTPNWLNRLPGSAPHAAPDGFLSRREFVDYLSSYARSFAAPVLRRVAVERLERAGERFRVATSSGAWLARDVVIATGDSEAACVPALAAASPRLKHLHTSAYRSPAALPPGGVLVVGAGPCGQQIALELARSGRRVVLAVGRHARMVRRYRGRDVWRWLAAMGDLDRTLGEVPDPHAALRAPNLVLSGANGGEPLDLGILERAGVLVTGRLESLDGHVARLAGDLPETLADADRRLRRLLARIDRHVAAAAVAGGAPAEPEVVAPVVVRPAPRALHLVAAGIGTVLWATGLRPAHPWLHVPVVGPDGAIRHRRGMTPVPGLSVLGLKFQHRRSSHLIGSVGADAAHLARQLLERRGLGPGGVSSRRASASAEPLGLAA